MGNVRRAMAAPSAACLLLAVSAMGPSGPVDSFRFGAAGDFGLGSAFRATVNAVQLRQPDLMIALGDLTQTSTGEQQWCSYWRERLTSAMLFILPGNHDTNIGRYVRHCGNPGRAKLFGLYPWQYTVDYPVDAPIARFIMVSPDIDNGAPIPTDYSAGTPGYAVVAGAIDDARARGVPWIVVSMHKNYITAFTKRNEVSTDPGRTFMTMLLDKRVDLILQGHDHGYQRSKQLATNPSTCPALPVDAFDAACVADADDDLVRGAGTVILILSTGGKGMRLIEPSDTERDYFVDRYRDKDNETFGFGEFTVTPTALTFAFVASQGLPFEDSFRITAPR